LAPVVVAIAGLVGVVSLLVAGASWRALVRTGNRTMGFVLAAFVLVAVKNLAKAAFLLGGSMETEAIETLFSLMDLAAVGLIAWPIVGARG
jgi:hypothetical protein